MCDIRGYMTVGPVDGSKGMCVCVCVWMHAVLGRLGRCDGMVGMVREDDGSCDTFVDT